MRNCLILMQCIYFPVTPSLCFKTRLSAKPLIRKLSVILMQIRNIHFHNKGSALLLALKVRVFGRRKFRVACTQDYNVTHGK